MKFDVSRFKKVKANDRETTLLHPHGHTITLSHEKIKPEMKKVLDALPMAEGGMVPEEGSLNQGRAPTNVASDFATSAKKAIKSVAGKAKDIISDTDAYNQFAATKIKHFNEHDEDYQFASKYANEPVELLKAQAWQESKLNPSAESRKHAKGIMQFMPVTWSDIKQKIKTDYNKEKAAAAIENRPINPTIEHIYNNVTTPENPKASILASGYYIKKLKDSGFKQPEDWLRAYNMGPTAYRAALSGTRAIPKETQEYPEKILRLHKTLTPSQEQAKVYTEIPTPLKQFGEQPTLTDEELFKQNRTEMQPWESSRYAPSSEGFDLKNYGPNPMESGQREPTPMPNLPTPPPAMEMQSQEVRTEPAPRPNQAPPSYRPAEPVQQQPFQQQPAQQQAQPAGGMTFNQMPGISQGPQAKAQQAGMEGAPTEDRFGFGAYQKEIAAAREQGLQGTLMPGQAYEQYAKDSQDILRKRNQEYKALWDRANQYKTDYTNEIKNTAAKIQQVDASRWLHNNVNTVPQKITTAIGLLLSGVGAGGTGQNLAAKWINDQIDRDIDAQKANITTQQNLMRVYNEHFRNLTDSEQMTRAVMQEYYAGLIEQQANKLTSKVKQAEGLRAAADFRMKAAAEIQNIAQRGAMMDYTMGVMGGVNGQTPEGKIRALETVGMIPKERADKMYKDIQEYRANTSKMQEFETAFKEVARLSYEKARFANPIQFKQRIDFLRAQLLGPLSRDLAGKFSEFEAKNLENLLPKYIDSDETVKFKTDKFMKILQNIYSMPGFAPNYPELNAYGIKLSPYTQQPMRQEAPTGYMGR